MTDHQHTCPKCNKEFTCINQECKEYTPPICKECWNKLVYKE